MLVDINPSMELPEYNLVLCKLNEEPIQELYNIDEFSINRYHADIDEISFNVPFNRSEPDGSVVRNEIYDIIDGDMLILLNDMQYFYIDKSVINTDESSGEKYKSIHCYGREFELSQKKLIGYKGISRLIYDYENGKDENGLEIGFLNYVERVTSWRVGYINSNVLLKYRELDFSNSNLLQASKEVQSSFECLFVYDTINKEIDIYEATQLGTNQGLYISDKNFLQSLEQTIENSQIKTRLYIYGKDNISIQNLSVTGKPYLENYSFYKNTKYMSQGLIDNLNSYEAYVTSKGSLFNGHISTLETLHSTLSGKSEELFNLNTELKVILNNLDIATFAGSSTTTLKANKLAKDTQIANKEAEINAVIANITATNILIADINIDTDISNFLTDAQMRELDSFIKEDSFSDSNYTEDNLQELYDKGVEVLKRVSSPNIQFTLDVVDFLSMVECQHIWNKLSTGDIVTLEHEELGIRYEVRFIGLEHKPKDNSLTLKFSNKNSIDDANIYLAELIESMSTTSSTVDFNKSGWDKAELAESTISKYITGNLNLAKQQLLKAEGQKPIWDDRGYWGYKVNPDNSIDPKQLRMTNEVIALTQDNWNSLEVAISADKGINANLIQGNLGRFAKVYANSLIVGDGGELIPKGLVEGFTEVDNFVNSVYPADLQAIRDQIDGKVTTWFYEHEPTLTNEPAVDWATSIDKDNHLGDTFYDTVTGYSYRFALLNSVYQWVRITDSDVTRALELASKAQDTADKKRTVFMIQPTTPYDAGDLWRDSTKTDLQVCVNSRATGVFVVSDWENSTNITEYLNTQFTELSDSVTGLETSINNTLSDSKVTNIEANSLKLSLEQVNKESTDILGVALSLGITTDRTNYATALSNLTTELNKWINQVSYPLNIDTTQRNNINTLFSTVENLKSKLVNAIMAKRESNTKGYIDTEVEQLDTAVDVLSTAIGDYSSDLKLTLAEANSLKTLLESLKSESLDLINIADSLTVPSNSYSTSLSTLETFLVNNWLGKTYPLTITTTQRTSLTSYFKDVENKKSLLINAIMAKREDNTKAYTESKIVDFNTNTLVPTVTDLTNQIDGKIETWNQDTDPSVSWTTTAIKTKHAGDMWYNTTTKELKHYSGSAWVLIEDKKAYEALGVANTKRTIFTSTPTPPYLVGDLWKVSGVDGIDFRVCMTANTIEYLASNWVDVNNSKVYVDAQKTELDTAITGLGTTITTAFSDGSVTNIEAQSLKLTRNTLIREANDVRAIAVGLSLSVSSLDSAITALNTEVDKYVDKTTYPVSATITARNNLNSAFTTMESRIVALYNSIESKKVTDLSSSFNTLVTGLQTQVDGKIETFAQTDDPSTAWTTASLKSAHSGDIWYHTTSKITKRWSGTAWVALEDATAISASALASSKNKIYTAQPTTPYIVGDLWINNQEIYRCATALATGAYNATHWVKAVKYTDDATAIANLATAKTYAETKATDAKTSAEAYAKSKAEAERVIAVAHADGIVSAEEQARINDANAKLTTAKTYAETKAGEAETASKAYAEAQMVVATNYADGLANSLQTQIDGKIDTWFYAVSPTLSNTPYNTWTSLALRDAHVDDLYYNTANGYVFKFTKTGTVYSWERIKDADIVTAMTSASTAQATADGKMTVYISQPTAGYKIGDLWRPSASATDLKICTKVTSSTYYTASDWSDATNVSGALSGLQGSIDDFSSDLKLTLAEANSLKISLESVTSESTSLVSTAGGLGITTEKTNYSTAITTLTNYLNTYWLGKTYPLAITTAQRTTVTSYFKDLENKKSILITKIADARAIKEVNDNAVKLGVGYQRFEVDDIDGAVVRNASNAIVTQMGYIDSDGNGSKDAYGFRANHDDGTFSALVGKGFIRKYPYGEGAYLNDIYAITNLSGTVERNDKINVTIELPERFQGRGGKVDIILIPIFFKTPYLQQVRIDGTVSQRLDYITMDLKVVSSNFNLTKPTITIDAWITVEQYRFSNETTYYKYAPVSFNLIVIGR